MKIKSIKLYFFIIFTFLSLVLSLNYLFQRSYRNVDFPFGLSKNYVEYSIENNINPVLSSDLKNFLLDKKIIFSAYMIMKIPLVFLIHYIIIMKLLNLLIHQEDI